MFGAQPATDVLAYGRTLLDDVKRYIGNEPCEVAVESTFATSSTDACADAPDWCSVGAQDPSTDTWSVTWTYVRGSYAEGVDTVEAWNASP